MSVWDDLPGQEPVVTQLRGAAESERPTHAWLFTGPPGSGRSNAARAFAAALLCERAELQDRGCGSCHACHTVMAGTHADVTNVATEKVTHSIAEVRELITNAQNRPSSGRWRIIIVEDADRMAERTTNVLLKAIEEPPPRTIWILCAPSPADVMVTIRSRCRPVSLRVPPREAVAELLVRRDGATEAQADYAARVAQSHIGVARRLARDEGARERRTQIVGLPLRLRTVPEAVVAAGRLHELATEEAKSSSEQRVEMEKTELLRSLGAPETGTLPPSMRSQVKQLEDDQKRRAKRSVTDALDRAMIDLTTFFRDVLTIQLGTGTELINEQIRADLERYAAGTTPEATLNRLDAIAQTRTRLGTTNVAPLLALEAMAVSLL